MTIQTILFPRSKFTEKEAKLWLQQHNFKFGKVDKTENYLRYRQYAPNFNRYITKILPNGVELVIGLGGGH